MSLLLCGRYEQKSIETITYNGREQSKLANVISDYHETMEDSLGITLDDRVNVVPAPRKQQATLD